MGGAHEKMTDNRTTELTATERICEQLEAAGVSFVRSEHIEGMYWGVTWFVGETKFEFRENDKRTDLIAFNATPEQAIAATLGSQIDADLRKALDFMRIWISEDAHLGESAYSRELEKAEGLRKLDAIEQAIATTLGSERHPYEQRITGDGSDWGEIMRDAYDSLMASACESCTPEQIEQLADYIRAELESGTCEPKWTLQGETQTQEFWSCKCGNCGEHFGTEDRESFPFKITVDKVDIPNFCPNCGRKVVKR